MWPATIAFVEIRPTDGSERCIEPPFPLHTPVARPISSAIIASGSTPLSERLAVPAVRGEDEVVREQGRESPRP